MGYGAHPDPATELAATIVAANAAVTGSSRPPAFVASVCGTPADPQDLGRQEKLLRRAGALLADSNAQAVRLAAAIAAREHR